MANTSGSGKKVFSMVVTTAASERNFSTLGCIHSKLQNKLSKDVLEKLAYVKTNNGEFTKQMPLLKAIRDSEELIVATVMTRTTAPAMTERGRGAED